MSLAKVSSSSFFGCTTDSQADEEQIQLNYNLKIDELETGSHNSIWNMSAVVIKASGNNSGGTFASGWPLTGGLSKVYCCPLSWSGRGGR